MIFRLFQKLEHLLNRNRQPFFGTIALTLITIWWVRRKIAKPDSHNTCRTKQIPCPKGRYFYFGISIWKLLIYIKRHLFTLGKNFGSKVTEWHEKLGPIFRIQIGVQSWVFIGNSQVAHEIFTTKDMLSSGRPFCGFGRDVHSQGARGLMFVDCNKKCKVIRGVTAGLLSIQCVDSLHTLIENHTKKTIDTLTEDCFGASEDGICPAGYIRLSSISFMMHVVFGTPALESVEDPLYKEEKKESEFIKNKEHPFYRNLMRKACISSQFCLIKNLNKVKDIFSMDEEDVLVIAIELVMSGSENITQSKLFSLATLCHYPEWQQKMRIEVGLFLKENGRMPRYQERNRFPFVLSIMKELLRFRPPTYFGIPHRATENIVYEEYIIPKNTVLISSYYSANGNKLMFDEPKKFRPERYIEDKRSICALTSGDVADRNLFSFGWGKRACPGVYLAETEFFDWLCQLIAHHAIEPVVSANGQKVYPNIDNLITKGTLAYPAPFKIRLIKERE
ncbi:cytochrome P450 [Sporodiniella umbellata]|nr:cytochrome P450 [Sporodiniella umbellata]